MLKTNSNGNDFKKNMEKEYFCRKMFENWIYFNLDRLQIYIPVALTSCFVLNFNERRRQIDICVA